MYRDLLNLAKHGTIYTFGIVLSKIISFIMIPIYTNLLLPEEYGTLQLLVITIDLISVIFSVGLTSSIMRYYFKENSINYKDMVISSALISIIAIFTVASIIFTLFSGFFSKMVFASEAYSVHFKIMFLTMLFAGVIEMPLLYLRAVQKSKLFIIISLARLIIQLSLNILFLVVFGMGVLGVLYSGLITSIIIVLYLSIYTFKSVGFKYNFGIMKQLFIFGFPIIFSDISTFVLTFSNRYFLNHFCDLHTVGIFSLSYKFGILVSTFFISPFNQIWGAKMFEFADKDNAAEIFSKILNYYIIIGLTLTLGLSLLTKDALRIISNPSYWPAYRLVPYLSISYIINGMIYIIYIGILLKEKTKYIALSTIAAALVSLSLNYLIIPPLGGKGAALSTLISYSIRLILIAIITQKFFYIKYDWKLILKSYGLFAIMVIIGLQINIENIYLSLLIFTIIFFSYPVILYYIQVISKNEKEYVIKALKNPYLTVKKLME
jgi:O-antigen/teichoic acid export membrane protein